MDQGNGSYQILVVDDDEQFRLMVAKSARAAGHQVIEAGSAEEAIQIFKNQRPPIVIADVRMPGISGLELTKVLLSQDPNVLIALMTGKSDEQMVLDSLKVGAADFLKKPFQLADFRALLSRFVWMLRKQRERMLTAAHFESFEMTFRLNTLKSALVPAVHLVRTLLKGVVSGPDLSRIEVGLQEILANAYEHGNLGVTYDEKMRLCEEGTLEESLDRIAEGARAAGKKIGFSVRIKNGVFECTVTDDGDGFDWKTVPDPLRGPEDLLNLNGRGNLLVRKAFDEVVYNEKGNQITVRKKLPIGSASEP